MSSRETRQTTTHLMNDIAIQATDEATSSSDGEKSEEYDFSSPFLFSDMSLVVDNQRLHCHRAILSLYSPFFKAMFEGQFQETATKEVPLPKDDADTVRELLRHLYTPGGRDMDSTSAQRLLPLIHRFQIDFLIATAERTMTFSMTDGVAPRMLALADLYGLTHLKQAAIDACSRLDMARLTEAMEETTLSPEMKTTIFGNRVILLEKCITDIQRSFTHSCIRMESKLERIPTNHCQQHSAPLATKTVRIGVHLPQVRLDGGVGGGDQSEATANLPDADDTINLIRPVIRGDIGREITSATTPPRHSLRPRGLTTRLIQSTVGINGETVSDVTAVANVDASAATTPVTAGADANSPFAIAEVPVVCETCVDRISTHIKDLCKRALHKTTFVVYKAG